jgi:hypothetical protein
LPGNPPLKMKRMDRHSAQSSDRVPGRALPQSACAGDASDGLAKTVGARWQPERIQHGTAPAPPRVRLDARNCIGRIPELRTALTSPTTPGRIAPKNETQGHEWQRWHVRPTITLPRWRWSRTPKHNQILGEVIQFRPSDTSGSRMDAHRVRRTALFGSTECTTSRRTDALRRLCVNPSSARTRTDRQNVPARVEHFEDTTRLLSDNGIFAIAADTFLIRTCPPDLAAATLRFGLFHRVLMGRPGIVRSEAGSLAMVAADDLKGSANEYSLTSATPRTSSGIRWPAIDLVPTHTPTQVGQIAKRPERSNPISGSFSLEDRETLSERDPIGGRAS